MVRREGEHLTEFHKNHRSINNTVYNYQLIWADMSDPHHIKGHQREMRLSDGTNSGMGQDVCFACSWVFLKVWEYMIYLFMLKVICFWLHQNETHNKRVISKFNAFPRNWAGFSFIYLWSIYHLHVYYN